MAFTYDLGSADETIVAKSTVRFELGDTQPGRGVRANGTNISDEELSVVFERESIGGDSVVNRRLSIMRTVAGLCEMLARDWSRVASISVGPRSSQYGTVARQWADRAVELREQYGGSPSGHAFSVAPRRADGYAENASGAEYG